MFFCNSLFFNNSIFSSYLKNFIIYDIIYTNFIIFALVVGNSREYDVVITADYNLFSKQFSNN